MELAQLISGLIILVGVLLMVRTAIVGPTLMDRILAVNVIGTKTIVLLALVGFLQVERTANAAGVAPDFDRASFFLDIALAYALINFIATIAIMRYLESRARARGELREDLPGGSRAEAGEGAAE